MIGLKYLYAMLAGAFSGQPALNLRGRRPTGSQLRNPADPVQAARIEAAAAKRERRAQKLYWIAKGWVRNNKTHKDGNVQLLGNILSDTPARLNPIYVAK